MDSWRTDIGYPEDRDHIEERPLAERKMAMNGDWVNEGNTVEAAGLGKS